MGLRLILSTTRVLPSRQVREQQIDTGILTIGRGTNANWVIDDPDRQLSKLHCRVDWQRGGYWLTDTSTNGTTLSGVPVPAGAQAPRGLKDGDRVTLGDVELLVRLAAAPTPTLETTAQPAAGSPRAGSLVPDADEADADEWGIAAFESGAADQDSLTLPRSQPSAMPSAATAIPEDWNDGPPLPARTVAAETGFAPLGDFHLATLIAGAGLPPREPGDDARRWLARLSAQYRTLVVGLHGLLSANETVHSAFADTDSANDTTRRALAPVADAFGTARDADEALALLLAPRLGGFEGERVIDAAFDRVRAHQNALLAAMRLAAGTDADDGFMARFRAAFATAYHTELEALRAVRDETAT